MKFFLVALGVMVFSVLPVGAFAEIMSAVTLNPTSEHQASEIHVSKDGTVLMENIRVIQIAGTTFFGRVEWDGPFIRLTVRTSATTKLMRLDGDLISAGEIRVGDYLNVKGKLVPGTDNLAVSADMVKDISLRQQERVFSGTVGELGTTTPGFTLKAQGGNLFVHANAETRITKGSLTLPLGSVAVGDRITSVVGTYNPASNSIQATNIVVYVDATLFKEKNFQGTLVGTADVTARSFRLSISGVIYRVELTPEASILDAKRRKANLARFIEGDTVRVWGAIQESDTSLIKASIARNVDL